jgi:sodium transport system permease protein
MIFRKELVDLLRDRKTVIGAFLIPIVVIPLVFILLGTSMNNVELDARSNIPLAVQGDVNHPLVRQLLTTPGVRLIDTAEPQTSLKEAEIRAILTLPENFDEQLRSGGSASIAIWYDPSNQKSEYARTLIEEAIGNYEAKVVKERLQAAGLRQSDIDPIKTTVESIASDEKLAGSMLSSIVPLMLILSLASGGMPAATDLVAGEKERGTLESLVSSPVPARSILTAKLMAVMIMSCVSGIASMISLSLVFSMVPMAGEKASVTLQFLQADSIAVLLLMVLLLSAMFAGLEIAISTWAKSFKEAQTYMTPVVFLALVPSYMIMPLNPADIPFWYYVLPVFNGAAIMKEIFYGELSAPHALAAVASTFVYVAIVIRAAAHFFRNERLVTKG